jgi:hypothetical protein
MQPWPRQLSSTPLELHCHLPDLVVILIKDALPPTSSFLGTLSSPSTYSHHCVVPPQSSSPQRTNHAITLPPHTFWPLVVIPSLTYTTLIFPVVVHISWTYQPRLSSFTPCILVVDCPGHATILVSTTSPSHLSVFRLDNLHRGYQSESR